MLLYSFNEQITLGHGHYIFLRPLLEMISMHKLASSDACFVLIGGR